MIRLAEAWVNSVSEGFEISLWIVAW